MKKLFLLLPLLLSACATIITGGSQKVKITGTDITGKDVHAYFEIINKSSNEVVAHGTTPSVVRLDAGDGYFGKAHYRVNLSSDKYLSDFTDIDPSLNPWYFGNLILGGWPGMLIIDPLTGAMWKLPEHSYGSMRPPATDTEGHFNLSK